jgi:hypothetical protein
MFHRSRNVGTALVTGDGRPVVRSQVTNAEASRSGSVVHAFADDVGGQRLIWDMGLQQAESLLVCLQVCVANAKADGYAAQDAEAAQRRRREALLAELRELDGQWLA